MVYACFFQNTQIKIELERLRQSSLNQMGIGRPIYHLDTIKIKKPRFKNRGLYNQKLSFSRGLVEL